MAARLIRQPDQLALFGAPTSAAAAAAGCERGPAALRAAGLVVRLQAAGYQVTDTGDLPEARFDPDPDNPRARNLRNVLAVLDLLRSRIEQSARTRAFPFVIGGDSTVVLALLAGLRRQAASIGLVHLGRRASLHTPRQTEDGLVELMTVSHLVGEGAPEMIRFWKDPPLVRQPDLVLFGLGELDEVDRERLARLAVRAFPLARIRRDGALAAAETALDRLRAAGRDFVVHLGLDVFSPEEVPGSPSGVVGGLRLAEVTEVLACFAARPSFGGLSVSGYDPMFDPEGRGARAVVELLAGALAGRRAALLQPPAPAEPLSPPAPVEVPLAASVEPPAPEPALQPATAPAEPLSPPAPVEVPLAASVEPPAPEPAPQPAIAPAEPLSPPAPVEVPLAASDEPPAAEPAASASPAEASAAGTSDGSGAPQS